MTRINPHWWRSASTEQRLAQVDAGIELGMTARQVALVSGARMYGKRGMPTVVTNFASFHGRSFHGRYVNAANRRKSALAAYNHGEPVDFWSDNLQQRGPQSDELPEVVFE